MSPYLTTGFLSIYTPGSLFSPLSWFLIICVVYWAWNPILLSYPAIPKHRDCSSVLSNKILTCQVTICLLKLIDCCWISLVKLHFPIRKPMTFTWLSSDRSRFLIRASFFSLFFRVIRADIPWECNSWQNTFARLWGFYSPNSLCSPFPLPGRVDFSANFTHSTKLPDVKFQKVPIAFQLKSLLLSPRYVKENWGSLFLSTLKLINRKI